MTALEGAFMARERTGHALQRPPRISARLVLHAVAAVSLQRDVNRPNLCLQRSSARICAVQYCLLLGAMGAVQRASTLAASSRASSPRPVAAA